MNVARAMDILTVAESVESLELLPHLREVGIDYGQGFALSFVAIIVLRRRQETTLKSLNIGHTPL